MSDVQADFISIINVSLLLASIAGFWRALEGLEACLKSDSFLMESSDRSGIRGHRKVFSGPIGGNEKCSKECA
jgi:hypothetical protein